MASGAAASICIERIRTSSESFTYLRDAGHIEMLDIGGLSDRENLVDKIQLTPAGNFYIEVRQEYENRASQNSG
jgi:hypothetical protein